MNLRYVRDDSFRKYKVATETSGMKNDETTSDELFYRAFGSVPGKLSTRMVVVIDVAYLHVKGTPLMMRLENFVKQFLAEKVATDPIWKSLEVTFLGQQVILVACYDIT
jgi:5'-3' exonuclease